jgi:hypothetical protein
MLSIRRRPAWRVCASAGAAIWKISGKTIARLRGKPLRPSQPSARLLARSGAQASGRKDCCWACGMAHSASLGD